MIVMARRDLVCKSVLLGQHIGLKSANDSHGYLLLVQERLTEPGKGTQWPIKPPLL